MLILCCWLWILFGMVWIFFQITGVYLLIPIYVKQDMHQHMNCFCPQRCFAWVYACVFTPGLVSYAAKLLREETFVVREENDYLWENLHSSMLVTYIANRHNHIRSRENNHESHKKVFPLQVLPYTIISIYVMKLYLPIDNRYNLPFTLYNTSLTTDIIHGNSKACCERLSKEAKVTLLSIQITKRCHFKAWRWAAKYR